MQFIVGIDVAKDKLDICLVDPAQKSHQQTFTNSKSGVNRLHRWLKKQGAKMAHICLEATGIYGDMVAETLYKRKYRISVVNPARIKAYAASQMQRNKTNALDAAVIADYYRTQQPLAWDPASSELKELRALVRHYDDLKQEKQRVANRLEAQRSSLAVIRQLRSLHALLNKQLTQPQNLIRAHIDKFPSLKQQRDLLKTIPGIGEMTACRLLIELGDIRRFDNVREVVAFVGLNPRQHHSGKKRVTLGISRMGRASLRADLYMPAIVAKQYNPVLKAFAERLQQRGLVGKQIIVAVMRKLIHLAFAILKSGRAFDHQYGQKYQLVA